MRSRRAATDALVRQADERAEAERQGAARVLAEERLRIAQELHDIVAHSMSVIAVQAGVGVHVLDERPEQARAVLETISATSRGTLNEMRRLLGVLRDGDGARSHGPAPGLADLPRLVDDVRAAGVPATLHVDGDSGRRPGRRRAVRLPGRPGGAHQRDQARRHTEARRRERPPPPGVGGSRGRRRRPRARRHAAGLAADGSGHGLLGMRERVELWGGELVGRAGAGRRIPGHRAAAVR